MDWLVSDRPVELIDRDDGALRRPEDIAFTPDGCLMAVANSEGDSVGIYRRDDSGGFYATRPIQVIRDSRCLGYVHGVDFSPDGLLLAAVGRETHSLALFARPDADTPFDPQPKWVMFGAAYGLCYPSGVAFHPTGRNLVVSNRMGEPSLAFYVRTPHASHSYGYSALRSVSREAFANLDLQTPHALAYSPDGLNLATCHAHFFKSNSHRGQSGMCMIPWSESSNSLDAETPSLVRLEGGKHLHSLAFHPSGSLLGVTRCDGHTTLFANDAFRALTPVSSITHPRPRGEEGPKGIGFTPDGRLVGVSTVQDEVQAYALAPDSPAPGRRISRSRRLAPGAVTDAVESS